MREIRSLVYGGDPMLPSRWIDLIDYAEQAQIADLDSELFPDFADDGCLDGFQPIDLAAGKAPMVRFRRSHALEQQDLAVSPDDGSAAATRFFQSHMLNQDPNSVSEWKKPAGRRAFTTQEDRAGYSLTAATFTPVAASARFCGTALAAGAVLAGAAGAATGAFWAVSAAGWEDGALNRSATPLNIFL